MEHETAFRVADLSQNSPTSFALRPAADLLASLARELDLLSLRKLSFNGDIRAQGKNDWLLSGTLGATVSQPCVVTLEPVTTRIDVPVRRLFLANWDEPLGEEVEMPEDDEIEQLGTEIDPAKIMVEALSLSLPQYPRKDGADVEQTAFTEPGKQAMTDEDAKPFAGLASLRDSLKK